MITVLANMRINSPQRLAHLQDSFPSFASISDNWLINIRGDYREPALKFLKKHLEDRATFFELLDDDRGWSTNCLDMLNHAQYDYIYLWVEDHINISAIRHLKHVIKQAINNKVDFIFTSWWAFGRRNKRFIDLGFAHKLSHILFVDLTPNKWSQFTNDTYRPYIIPMQGVFKKDLLNKLMHQDQHMWPVKLSWLIFKLIELMQHAGIKLDKQLTFQAINRLVAYKLRRFPRQTPFNIEMDSSRMDIFPIRYALPNQELFASIDDDAGINNYSLKSRGLYPLS